METKRQTQVLLTDMAVAMEYSTGCYRNLSEDYVLLGEAEMGSLPFFFFFFPFWLLRQGFSV